MNNIIAQIVTGKVIDENDKRYFVQVSGETFELDKSEIEKPLQLGADFTGFTYENEQHKMQITRNIPAIRRDHYGFATVVKEKFGLGVFVDIGLPNKDVVVSIDELPTLRALWPQAGDKLLISLVVDKKNRIWGHLADEEIFMAIARPITGDIKNKNLKARVYRLKMAGTRLLTENYHLAFLHPDERLIEPRLGEEVEGRVIGMLRDGTINISTRPRAYQEIGEDAKMILAALEHTDDKQLEFSDKSTPDSIKDYFGISKGAFKRALGHLLKEQLIVQESGHIALKK
ncbi:MAG: S1-like domain-containing RNA-binding protein [Lentilactobacillus diolivorans]|jgi:predicted RNA-binding protein (virulence factor B family)|uniref:CvfB family protein n=1 Tax=Lentilactobacillus diolivorans TaxID=179838 RepID=UPI000FEF3970|nr:S1-like domain-containing RNA-binding protein [Lentilactobacillus diolivorans]MCH4163235.1 S1-like domain-containing RNA-binding protein [Lentilactobacillus diolivorans]MDH5106045.1 S1-like domain-containing RNA-binding protein [Lentilactobacillus diolivorans]RRG04620.1 MAG: DNA-binding protein [Lactobacillus sp.]